MGFFSGTAGLMSSGCMTLWTCSFEEPTRPAAPSTLLGTPYPQPRVPRKALGVPGHNLSEQVPSGPQEQEWREGPPCAAQT